MRQTGQGLACFGLKRRGTLTWGFPHIRFPCIKLAAAFEWEDRMGKRLDRWSLAGFFAVSVLGTLTHFCYEWSGEKLLVGAFCAVNESTWEHMKLLFFPVLLFTMVQLAAAKERDGAVPAARAVSVTAGLALIPTLYYTYTGVWGRHVMWADIAIFYLAAALVFWLDTRLRRRQRLWKTWQQAAGLVWLWVLAFLFVWWTFRPPHIGIFLDPVTGSYGIP